MPTYVFRCPDGHDVEVFQRFDDPAPAACEICGKGPVTKVLYPVPVHFKGSGFYSTDYGRGAKKKETDGEKKADEGVKTKEKKEKAPAD